MLASKKQNFHFKKPGEPALIPFDFESPPALIPVKSWETRYHPIRELGAGAFGSVVLAKSADPSQTQFGGSGFDRTLLGPSTLQNSSNLFAVKKFQKKLKRIKNYQDLKEIKFILNMPPNPHLVKIYEIFVDDLHYHLRVVMEAMNQDLFQLITSRPYQPFSRATLRSISAQLLAAISHIHSHDFYHRDIKPENILLTHKKAYFGEPDAVPSEWNKDRFVVKLADYGMARSIYDTANFTPYVGTRWYRAPELVLKQGYYSKPLDIWSFGCVVAEMIRMAPLFPGENELDQIARMYQIIGSPTGSPLEDMDKSGSSLGLFNFGGSWDMAVFLLEEMSLPFYYSPGIPMNAITTDLQMQEVLQRCLKWDPEKRSTSEELCKLDFFKDVHHLQDLSPYTNNYVFEEVKENLPTVDMNQEKRHRFDDSFGETQVIFNREQNFGANDENILPEFYCDECFPKGPDVSTTFDLIDWGYHFAGYTS